MKNNVKLAIGAIILIIGIAGVILASGLINTPNQTTSKINNSNVTPGQTWTDVSYANVSSSQKMDIYLPNSTGPYPVIIAIHGGGYQSGDKSGKELESVKQALTRGYAVVSINYRLSGEAKFPAQINDLKAAIRFLRANAVKYNLNPDKFAVWGSSAGGGLASLAGTSGGVKELQDDSLGNSNQSDNVQAVVDLFGPINFSTMDTQFQQSGISGQTHNSSSSPESNLMGQDISLIPDQVAKANPETYITSDDPFFFIQHGKDDKLIPYQQSSDFAAKLESVLGKEKVTLELIEGAGHMDSQFSTTENINKILDFLDANLK